MGPDFTLCTHCNEFGPSEDFKCNLNGFENAFKCPSCRRTEFPSSSPDDAQNARDTITGPPVHDNNSHAHITHNAGPDPDCNVNHNHSYNDGIVSDAPAKIFDMNILCKWCRELRPIVDGIPGRCHHCQQSQRRRKELRIAYNLCWRCEKAPRSGSTKRCADCIVEQEQRRIQRLSAGLCTTCGKSSVMTGFRQCESCRLKRRLRDQRRSRAKRVSSSSSTR